MENPTTGRPLVRFVSFEKGRSLTISSLGARVMEQEIHRGSTTFSIMQAPPALMKVHMGEITREELLKYAESTDVEIEGIRRSLLEVLKEHEIVTD